MVDRPAQVPFGGMGSLVYCRRANESAQMTSIDHLHLT